PAPDRRLRLLRSAERVLVPSFPTRRSSDLSTQRARFAVTSIQTPVSTTISPCTAAVSQRCLKASRSALVVSQCFCRGLLTAYNPDRKSTRLHSSHVKNSYAVLCSKKKTGIG